MPYSGVLWNGRVVRTTNFTNLGYTFDGYLVGFKAGGAFFYHFVYSDFAPPQFEKHLHAGYYNFNHWLEYQGGKRGLYEIDEYKYEMFEPAKKDDIIIVRKYGTLPPFDIMEEFEYGLICGGDNWYFSAIEIPIPTTGPESIPGRLSTNYLHAKAQLFYNNWKHYATDTNPPYLSSDRQQIATWLAKTAYWIHLINKDIFPLFSEPQFASFINAQNDQWTNGTVFTGIGPNAFKEYADGILNFYRSSITNKIRIQESPPEEKLYWLAVGLGIKALVPLTVPNKLDLLQIACGKLHKIKEKELPEELCVRIVASFNDTNISSVDAFLSGLISDERLMEDSGKNCVTLYQYIYERMSTSWNITSALLDLTNWVLNTQYKPTKTKGAFVQTVYALWQYSKYCPYNENGSFKPDTIGFKLFNIGLANFSNASIFNSYLFYYSHNVAYTAELLDPNATDPAWKDVYKYEITTPNAAPIVIPYESEKVVGFFFDNFNFKFKGKKIEAYELRLTGMRPSEGQVLGGMGVLPTNLKFDTPVKTDVLYGTYDIFQPITLANVEPETKVPFYSIQGNSLDVDGKTINSFIPIFVLEYIDSAGDRSDAETMIGYAADFVLTLTMVGNVSKIRHLRWAAAGMDTVGVFTLQGLTIVLDTVTFSSEVLRFFMQFVTCGTNDNFCHILKTISHILSVACLTLNGGRLVGIGTMALKRQMGRLVDLAANGATDAAIVRQNLKAKLQQFYTSADPATLDNAVNSAVNLRFFADPFLIGNAILTARIIIKNIKAIRIPQQLRLYKKAVRDTAVGEWVAAETIPRFSEFKYEFRTIIFPGGGKTIEQGRRIADTNGMPIIVHTETEVGEMVKFGWEQKLTREVADDMIFKSYRSAKQKTYSEVQDQMLGYREFLDGGQIPFCFLNAAHMTSFTAAYKNILDKYGLLKYLDEYIITGSSMTKRSALGLPPDLDSVGFLSGQQINEIINGFEQVFNKNWHLLGIAHARKAEIKEAFSVCRAKGIVRKDIVYRVEETAVSTGGTYKRLISLHDDFELIKDGASYPKLDPLGQRKIDFNIYTKSEEGRRLLPELPVKFN